MPLSAETIVMILRAVRDQEIRRHEKARAMAPARTPSDICAAQYRESQIQAALRQAIALGEREPALSVLKQVAEALHIDLHDSDPDAWALARQTNRLLMEISAERARRETGDYGTASILSELAGDVPDALPTDAFLTPINLCQGQRKKSAPTAGSLDMP